MKIRTETVAEIVTEVSRKMTDPNYSAVMVGGFVQEQMPTAQYLGAHEAELGGTEQVVNALFHAAVLSLCFQRANNRSIRTMEFADLDHAASGDRDERIKELQPALYEYIKANVEGAPMQNVLCLIALAMDWVS